MTYEQKILPELKSWQKAMQKKPSLVNRLSKKLQVKVNSYIPEKVHQAITATIKQMIRAVLFGAELTTGKPIQNTSLEIIEARAEENIFRGGGNYRRRGPVTWAG